MQTLRQIFDKVIRESMKGALADKALEEKEKQAAAAQDDPLDALTGGVGGGTPPAAPVADPGGGEEVQATPSKTVDADAEAMKKGKITFDDVVDKLNSIRSGRSFKDSGVSGAMQQYVESLTDAERTALFAFLKGIAGIVTGNVQAPQATEPKDNPSNVSMQKKNATQTKHIKPNVIKADQPGPSGSAKNAENTSAPIAVKKRA